MSRRPLRVRGRRVGGSAVSGRRTCSTFPKPRGTCCPRSARSCWMGRPRLGLWEGLVAQVVAHGYRLHRGECGGANGYTDPAEGVVRIRADVSDAQAVKTLAHELGHIECGHVQDLPTYRTCRGRCEVEAESVAYVVTAAQGLDAGAYTFGYVAGWAGGDVARCGPPVSWSLVWPGGYWPRWRPFPRWRQWRDEPQPCTAGGAWRCAVRAAVRPRLPRGLCGPGRAGLPSRAAASAAGVAAQRAGGFCFTVMWRAGLGGQ